MYDVIIVGGGPAGLTAAIYTCRRGLKTLLLTRDIGGQAASTLDIENYPGFDLISGALLSQKILDQAKKFEAEIKIEGVKKVSVKGEIFEVCSNTNSTYQSLTVILAFGKTPRLLRVPGEEEFRGHGVSYCATCDAPFFREKTIAVVGGGNSAVDAALLAVKFAQKVYLIHRRNELTAEEALVEKVESDPKIELILETEITKILGEDKVSEIELNNEKTLKVDGVLVEVGYEIDRSLIAGLVQLDEKNQVVVTPQQETSVPGIFAAGDLTPTPFKQIVIAAGEGAKAALSCFDYLAKKQGKRGIAPDWH